MKRFWLVLLSLALVIAFGTSAFAVDVKFSGSYYAAGVYQDKTNVMKDTASDGISTAFYYQRLRVQTDFIVSPGLSLVTRFDAMERIWGGNRSTAKVNALGVPSSDAWSAGTPAENENIAFDYAYVQYASPIGLFRVGYQGDGTWGTPFGDYDLPTGKVTYIGQFGPVTAIGYIAKFADNSVSGKYPTYPLIGGQYTDADIDMYCLAGIYSWKGGSAGLLWKGYRIANFRPAALGAYEGLWHYLLPYAKVQIGPVFIQAEIIYGFGDYKKFDSGVGDVKLDDLAGWIDATVDFGMFYFGGSFAYIAGDDPGTLDKKEGGPITGGADWNPCLLMFNFDRMYWAGGFTGYSGTSNPNAADNYIATNNSGMSNAYFLQGRAGIRPIAPLDIMGSISWAQADKLPAIALNKTYGTEVDVTATYKITNNLSYMLGVGYLFVGDYFKGTTVGASVKDDYVVLNKLTLTF
jgi:hypothetical protein